MGMSPFQRAQVNVIAHRLAEPPSRIIAVSGPRQTGKTTMVRQALQQVELENLYLSVDDPTFSQLPFDPELIGRVSIQSTQTPTTEQLALNWERARLQVERTGASFVLVLDEIQKVPGWSEAVKGLWDDDRDREYPLHVVILGSAPLLLQTGLSESLAGRFETIRVAHWSFPEMHQAFGLDLDEYLYFGGYPGAASLVRDEGRWRDYVQQSLVQPNIERDILAMTRVDKPALLKQLFELGTDYSGQVLSYNKMLGQLQGAGNTTTLARYLDLLTSAGLLTGLSNHSNQAHRSRGSSPKLNVLNTALMTTGSGYSFDEARADRTFRGRVVESAVGAHLCNTAASDINIRYWRNKQHEVDFVLQRGRRVVAIEVKSGPQRRSTSGMAEFEKQYHPISSLVVGADGIPLNEFLSEPAGHWFEGS